MSIFTISNLMDTCKPRAFYKFLIAISVIALLGAFTTEYILKLPPCVLCWYQRYCYFLLIIFSFIGLARASSKWVLGVVSIILFSACLIAGYHAGVERGLIQASKFCTSQVKITDNLSINEIKDMLYAKPVASCERAAFKIARLSMAEWNLLLNIGLLIILYFTWKRGSENNAKT
jgi:disulfide bond formation protein DsbB